jgi:hypothetical protein
VGKGQTKITITVNPNLLAFGRLQLDVKRRSDDLGDWLLYVLVQWAALHARFLVPAEQCHQGHVTFDLSSGGKEVIQVSATIAPTWWITLLGWVGVGTSMLAELAVVVGVLALF